MTQSQPSKTAVGVGIDTHRYFHQATFLDADRQRAAPNLRFAESVEGYAQLRQALEKIAARQPDVHFHIRVDAAGQYAANLQRYLRDLPLSFTFSVGEPARNKRYRQAISPKAADDLIDSYACGRFAVIERPPATLEVPEAFQALREVASRLESQVRQTTRTSNALHNLMSRVFPELATLVRSFKAQYLLELLAKYPTPEKLARARRESLLAIRYIKEQQVDKIQAAAQQSVGSLGSEIAEQLVRDQVKQVEPTKSTSQSGWVDFASLRQQITLEQVLSQAGCLDDLSKRGSQRRGRCPVHAKPGDRNRSFSADLKKNVFQCFDTTCGIHGNVLDFWAAWRRLPLRDAALDLAETFHLSPSPNREEEPVSKKGSSASSSPPGAQTMT